MAQDTEWHHVQLADGQLGYVRAHWLAVGNTCERWAPAMRAHYGAQHRLTRYVYKLPPGGISSPTKPHSMAIAAGYLNGRILAPGSEYIAKQHAQARSSLALLDHGSVLSFNLASHVGPGGSGAECREHTDCTNAREVCACINQACEQRRCDTAPS